MITLSAVALLFLIFLYLDLAVAQIYMSPLDVLDGIFGTGESIYTIIVRNYTAPRVVMACFVGAGLAISGAVMQALFRNPMASPYILGLSSGASLGAAIGMLFPIAFLPVFITTPLLAFIFCLGTMLLVYSLSYVGGKVPTETLLLSGIAVGALISAIVSALTYFSDERLSDIVFWSMGSLSQYGWENVLIAAPLVVIGVVFMISRSRELNAMMISDANAKNLGVNVKSVRLELLVMASLVTAASVAFVGVIGFVGLVVPHVMRILLGPDNRLLLPSTILAGAMFLVACDYISRIILPSQVLPVGIITSLIGAPYFIYLLRRRKNEVGWN
ncbi:MAG: iron ABC transporter permease [Lentisphaerae bacterium]|nr:iron ABC transporter permease [Lentisphaerota bacterium]